MTKKDYFTLAEILSIIKFAQDDLGKNIDTCKKAIDDILKQDNDKYNAEKFWQETTKKYLETRGIFAKQTKDQKT